MVLVWDFDGTLADSWYDIALTLNAALRDAGRPEAEPTEIRSWVGHGVAALVKRAASDMSDDQVEKLVVRFKELYGDLCLVNTKPFEGIVATLEALPNWRHAVASNKPAVYLAPMLEGIGLGKYFEECGGDSMPRSKPNPEALTHVAAELDVEPTSLWMIGDSSVDIEAARVVGAHSIGCSWGFRPRQELQAAGAEHIVDEPAEIISVLRGYS